MNTITATNARSNLFKLLKQTVKGHIQTRISSKEGNAVLLSEEDYESLLETAELLSVPGLKGSVKRANKEIDNGSVNTFGEIFG
jgi:antitoxin YefM